ncbi:type IX secretion system membrane protein PorP/SprF [Zhouia spongiae]|uniref:Type IX secretion system membrane protein PorP/SprF n=1 Tax=Zhouia spongiae TaxID=2202721 RepID=A0ABY3YKS2_9FLAO|nr:type IX secretion system membrane protein PorP/SprF [Zhouia spongiae]UNY98288.1 type IX secretion system membrane protein PorP/SprF [Zhouia spongiae]
MKIIKILTPVRFLSAIAFLCMGNMFAQQQPQFTQYMYNTLTINPGYTASNGRLEASLLHRSQWVDLDGAPSTQTFNIQGALNEKVGLGFVAVKDRIGPSDEIDLTGSFAYHLLLKRGLKIGLGINAGVDIFSVDWSKGSSYDPGDPTTNENINEVRPKIGAGAFLYSSNWYVGLSAPNFIKSNFFDNEEEVAVDKSPHYYLMGGYVFDLSDAVRFKPTVLAKMVSGSPVSVDVSANFLIQQKFTAGASYRFNDAMSALVGFQLSENIFAGYAFDYSTTGIRKYNDGSHEIILRYILPSLRKRARSPRFF